MSIQIRCRINRANFQLELGGEISSQGTTAIIGPSGSGKTSLLRVLAGLERHDGCEVAVNGKVWQNRSTWLAAEQRQLGFVFQEPSLFPHLSVAANIGFSRQSNAEELAALYQQLGVAHLLEREVVSLSGGEKQRVAIARALAAKPQLLLMDEPLSGLDESAKNELLPYLQRLHQQLEIPLIYVSHSVAEVAQLADQVWVLENGQLIANSDAASALTNPELSLAHSSDAGALLDARVSEINPQHQLAQLSTNAGLFYTPAKQLRLEQTLRLHIAARDVSLSLSHNKDSSINNILPATVLSINEEGSAQLLLQLQVGEAVLLARITRHSAERLQLATGSQLYAQIKAVAIF